MNHDVLITLSAFAAATVVYLAYCQRRHVRRQAALRRHQARR